MDKTTTIESSFARLGTMVSGRLHKFVTRLSPSDTYSPLIDFSAVNGIVGGCKIKAHTAIFLQQLELAWRYF